MKYYVYILKSKNKNWFYIGCTKDLNKRLEKHNKGAVRSTKAYKQFEPIFMREFENLSQARKYEDHLKSPKGYLEKLEIIKKYKD